MIKDRSFGLKVGVLLEKAYIKKYRNEICAICKNEIREAYNI